MFVVTMLRANSLRPVDYRDRDKSPARSCAFIVACALALASLCGYFVYAYGHRATTTTIFTRGGDPALTIEKLKELAAAREHGEAVQCVRTLLAPVHTALLTIGPRSHHPCQATSYPSAAFQTPSGTTVHFTNTIRWTGVTPSAPIMTLCQSTRPTSSPGAGVGMGGIFAG